MYDDMIIRSISFERNNAEADGESISITGIACSDAIIGQGYFRSKIDIPSANLSRLHDGATVLFNHNYNQVIGRITSCYTEFRDGNNCVIVKMNITDDEVKNNIKNHNLNKLSVGFRIDYDNMDEVKDDSNIDKKYYLLRNVEIIEASIVAIPADNYAKILERGIKMKDNNNQELDNKLLDKAKNQGNEDDSSRKIQAEIEKGVSDGIKSYKEQTLARNKELKEQGELKGIKPEVIARAIAEFKEVDVFLRELNVDDFIINDGMIPTPGNYARGDRQDDFERDFEDVRNLDIAFLAGGDIKNASKSQRRALDNLTSINNNSAEINVGTMCRVGIESMQHRAVGDSVSTINKSDIAAGDFITQLGNVSPVLYPGCVLPTFFANGGKLGVGTEETHRIIINNLNTNIGFAKSGDSINGEGGSLNSIELSKLRYTSSYAINKTAAMNNRVDIQSEMQKDIVKRIALLMQKQMFFAPAPTALRDPNVLTLLTGVGTFPYTNLFTKPTMDKIAGVAYQLTLADLDSTYGAVFFGHPNLLRVMTTTFENENQLLRLGIQDQTGMPYTQGYIGGYRFHGSTDFPQGINQATGGGSVVLMLCEYSEVVVWESITMNIDTTSHALSSIGQIGVSYEGHYNQHCARPESIRVATGS